MKKNYSLLYAFLLLIISQNAMAQCNSGFTIINSDPHFTFTPTNTVAGMTSLWTIETPDWNETFYTHFFDPATFTYKYNGTFNVRQVLYNSSGCSDTTNTLITVSNGNSCNAYFTQTPTFGNNWERNFTAGHPQTGASYFWDFDDGTTSTQQNPTHTYAHGYIYPEVCLTITNSANSCADTICHSLWYNDIPLISGRVKAGSSAVDSGMVFLIIYDSTAGTLQSIDTAQIGQNGEYVFWDIPPSLSCYQYLIKAALTPSSNYYLNYMPTYKSFNANGQMYTGELLWSNANTYWCNGVSFIQVNIQLVPGVNPGGPAFVGGLVSQGANKVGDPLKNVLVMVLNDNNEPVTYSYSQADGSFHIGNLAYGTYTLYTEVERKTTVPFSFTLSATNPNIEGFKIEVNSTTVDVSIISGIENIPPFNEVEFYPNPVQNSLNIDFGTEITTEVTINVMDISGRLISTQYFDNGTKTIIDTAPLSQGTYLLKLNSQDGTQVFQFVK